MENKTAVAVIGLGYWGKNLVRNYYDIGALKIICDTNPQTLDQYKSQYPHLSVCAKFGYVLGRDDIKGVILATPAETHFDLARRALRSQ